jgi:cysteinyl-tRNA synthetase
MDDDFNTPEAFGVLFELAKEINKEKADNLEYASQLGALLLKLGNWLGMLEASPDQFLRGNASADIDSAAIDQLIEDRNQAREDKNWQKADEIRDQLTAMKVILEDGADGSSWRIER